MKDSDRETLRARLRAADPYQGESLLASDAVRIKARMRAGAAGARTLPRWLPAAAAAAMAMVVAVAVGVWAGARTPVAEEAADLPAPVASAGDVGIEPSPDPVAITETQPGREPARTNLAVANPAPELPAQAERGAAVIAAPGATSEPQVALVETSVESTAASNTEARRIQFTARGGTRIVWTIDPDFEPSTIQTDAPPARHQQGANDKW